MMGQTSTGTAVLLRSGDVATWRFAVDLVGAAVSSGDSVALILFDAALQTLLSPPAEFARIGADLSLVRELAQTSGGFDLFACSGAVERVGADPDALLADGIVHDVLGLPAIWRHTRTMRLTTI